MIDDLSASPGNDESQDDQELDNIDQPEDLSIGGTGMSLDSEIDKMQSDAHPAASMPKPNEMDQSEEPQSLTSQNEEKFEYTLESAQDFSIGSFKYSLGPSTGRKSSRKSMGPKRLVSSINMEVKPVRPIDIKPTIKTNSDLKHDDIKAVLKSEHPVIKSEQTVIKSEQERKSDLENYLYLDHSDRPYPCNMCPKRFKERHHLIYHIRTHSGHRPYKCPICSKAFTQSSSLNTHKRTHWKDINCQKCSRVFRKQAHFYNHICME